MLKSIKILLKGLRYAKRDGQLVSGGWQRKPVILHRIPAICKQTLSDISDIRMFARACAAERSRNFRSLSQDPLRLESRVLIAAAKSVGRFVESSTVPGTRYTIRTGESEVRLDQVNRLYYKLKDPFAKLHLKQHQIDYVLYEHVVHNILFPDCRLEFVGVSDYCHGARFVFKQSAIRSVARPDDQQIAAALLDLGLTPEGRYRFGNKLVFVTDVGQDGDNVLVDTENNLRFVDPIVGFKAPLYSLLTEQSIMPLVCGLYNLTQDEIAFVESIR